MKVCAASALALVSGCAGIGGESDAHGLSKEECREASTCELVGRLTRSSDGHAWIGRLTLDSGECVNVSTPDDLMEQLGDTGEVNARLVGSSIRYPDFASGPVITRFVINGREIGIGRCGDFFVFIENSDDLLIREEP